MVDKGVKIIFLVANWPKPRDYHWETLLKARAIENQCFIVAVNRVGKSPVLSYFGKSMIIDPWGKVMKKGSGREKVIAADIDVKSVDKTRKRFGALKDRRPKLYKKI